MKAIKVLGFSVAVVFAAIGLIFLLIPDNVLVFFNSISGFFSLPQSGVQGNGFYLTLAAAYMYLVTVLAFLIYIYPREKWFPFLLANAKLASSAVSLFLFVADKPYLIYITNCVVDGMIGITVMLYYLRLRKEALAKCC